MKIGVCDWGIGGLGFYALLRAERPDLDVVYLGDQGVPGYGKFPRPVLAARLRAVLTHFRDLGVEHVVVACNAASTVLDEAQIEGVQTTGMIRPALASLEPLSPLGERGRGEGISVSAGVPGGPLTPSPSPPEGRGGRCIAVIGGRRTIFSGAYARPLRAMGHTVQNRVAQPLSGLIEDGKAQEAEAALGAILRPLKADRLILACTHYIVLEKAIQTRLPNTELIDPATLAWAQLAPTLPPKTDRVGTTAFLTTGDPLPMAHSAQAAFGVECAPLKIELAENAPPGSPPLSPRGRGGRGERVRERDEQAATKDAPERRE